MLTKNNVILKMYGGVLDFLFYSLVISTLVLARNCDNSDLSIGPCPDTQICDVNNTCICKVGFTKVNETYCEKTAPPSAGGNPPSTSSLVDSPGSGALVAWILIPVGIIALVIGTILALKRYKVVTWVRRKMYQRNNNYDEFMIGQDLDDDDPPLH